MKSHKIESIIDRLEELRIIEYAKAKKVFPRAFFRVALTFFILISSIITLVHLFGDPDKVSDGPIWPLFVFAVIAGSFCGLFLGGIYTLLRRGKINLDFWVKAKSALVEELHDDFKYQYTYHPEGMWQTEFKRAELFRVSHFDSNDLFKIKLGQKELNVAECHAETGSRVSDKDSTSFYGIFITLPFDMKGIEGPIKIVPSNKVKQFLENFIGPSGTKLTNNELEKMTHPLIESWGKYAVYGPKGTNIEEVLTNDIVERFKQLHDLLDKGMLNVNFSFNEDYLHISTNTLKDLFKANLLLKTSLKDSTVVADFQKDLKFIEQIADILEGM